MNDSGVGQDNTFSSLAMGGTLSTPLIQMLMGDEIQPGHGPGYQLCKTIYTYHPLGAILAEAPITRAQSQKRIISVPGLGEPRVIEQFEKVWDKISRVGATVVINNLMKTSRIYGIASLAVGESGKEPKTPLDIGTIADADLFFNVLDPLNTAGSLVLNQDPNSPDFLKQKTTYVNGVEYHHSRTMAMMHEQPLYIDWTNSAFGFVGRSVYQRALYPMKTFLQTMITDQMVTQKAGLLVYKAKSPGSIIDNLMQGMAAWKRGRIKAGVTGQALQIGLEEDVETLNMQNLDGAAKFARDNVLKNIASAAGMPASIVNNETLTEGFGEGSEDFKKEVQYLDYIREEMQPAYTFMDRIVMRKAWTPEFYASLKVDYPELRPFETWLMECMNAFTAIWPNLMTEPDSEKSKNDDVKMKSAVALAEVLIPAVDPENKAKVIMWLAENANEAENLFSGKLVFDEDALKDYFEENVALDAEAKKAAAEPDAPEPFAQRA